MAIIVLPVANYPRGFFRFPAVPRRRSAVKSVFSSSNLLAAKRNGGGPLLWGRRRINDFQTGGGT